MIPVCACVAATTTTVTAAAPKAGSGSGLGAGDVIALIAVIVSVVGLAVTIGVAAYTVVRQQKENRRQERATAYAEAIRAVEDYLETPYRIRRRDGSAAVRWELTESISEIQSRINFHKDWLRINASKDVYNAYIEFIRVARVEAGGQMTEAWNGPVTEEDRQVPLGDPLPQPESAATRTTVLEKMEECLKK
jgi:predicted lipid-binding transport protein (Tim44 family)